MTRRHRAPNSRQWEAVRRVVLDRDGWRCQRCGSYGHEVDHVVPVEQGGAMYDPANCQVLCRGCHIAKTILEAEARGAATPGLSEWRDRIQAICKKSPIVN